MLLLIFYLFQLIVFSDPNTKNTALLKIYKPTMRINHKIINVNNYPQRALFSA